MKQFRCIIKLADGWMTETIVTSTDNLTAMKIAEAQTGGTCQAAFEISK
jgi:hypothetical protein